MRKPSVLITGAGGEIGHGLIHRLADDGSRWIVTIDLAPLDTALAKKVHRESHRIDSRPRAARARLAEFEIDLVFHLAALLSTRSEFSPVTAHEVNVEGVEAAGVRPARGGIARPAGRLPVSVVDCGVRPPGTDAKRNAGRVREDQWALPTTMCGCNKLYCEQIGRYYAPLQTAGGRVRTGRVDFVP